MKLMIDRQGDVAYLHLRTPGIPVHRTEQAHPLVKLDYNGRGELVGIQLMRVPNMEVE